jgi:hypothetical protein
LRLQLWPHGHLSADQIGQQCWQAIVSALQPVVLDRYVLPFDVADFIEALAERGHIARVGICRLATNDSDHRHRRLLRACRERPCNCCAAERRYELPPANADCHLRRISRLKLAVCGRQYPRWQAPGAAAFRCTPAALAVRRRGGS